MMQFAIARIRKDQRTMLEGLKPGDTVKFRAWDASTITGTLTRLLNGDWCVTDADGARWLLDPRALITGKEV